MYLHAKGCSLGSHSLTNHLLQIMLIWISTNLSVNPVEKECKSQNQRLRRWWLTIVAIFNLITQKGQVFI